MGKLIITEYNNRLLAVLFDEKKPYYIESPAKPSNEACLGHIYLAKVKDVIQGIHGAFLAISEKDTVFFPYEDNKELLVASKELTEADVLKPGDEIVVQIVKEAFGAKQPVVSGALSLTGQYCVCHYFGHGITYSQKLDSSQKTKLEDAIRNATISGRKQYKFTIRTNAGALTDYEPLLEEMRTFIDKFNELKAVYKHRTVYTCFYKPEAELIRCVQNLPLYAYDEIVTDVTTVYEMLQNETDKPVRFYQDEMLSLSKLYSIETHLKEIFSKKVWLPSGGYLVIEPTEAMTVIDVNSGKTLPKDRKNTDYQLKVNLEAAKEIARQIRLRNYSGIIMVDFINMEKQTDNQKLLQYLEEEMKKDRVLTRLVDMTALGIVEITRKKTNKPLYEFFTTEG